MYKNIKKVVLVNQINRLIFGVRLERKSLFITVTDIEPRESKGYREGTTAIGYVGKGSDGYQYAYNYPNESISYSPGWTRYAPDDEFEKMTEQEKTDLVSEYIWYDVGHIAVPRPIPALSEIDGLKFCKEHHRHYFDDQRCQFCRHNDDSRFDATILKKMAADDVKNGSYPADWY